MGLVFRKRQMLARLRRSRIVRYAARATGKNAQTRNISGGHSTAQTKKRTGGPVLSGGGDSVIYKEHIRQIVFELLYVTLLFSSISPLTKHFLALTAKGLLD